MAGSLRIGSRSAAVGLLGVVATLTAAAGAAAAPSPGAPGLGDPFFPDAGNGGYDVLSYEIDLRFRPGRDEINARTTIRARATQDLSSFDLDFRGPRVRSVRVDAVAASHRREGQELIIQPVTPIADAAVFTAEVSYRGAVGPINDADGSKEGWLNTDDGSLVVAEPQGSPTWYPSNDYPTDKATFVFRVRVPRGLEAIANGELRDRRRVGRTTRWTWREDEPMATYLATLATGQFELRRSRIAGVRSLTAVDPRLWKRSRGPLRKSDRILALLEQLFGPYPFDHAGAIVDDASAISYALETQTRPVYDGAPDGALIAHELAHQWVGDSVSLSSWPEIWLNEGFATWAEWRWVAEAGGPTTAEVFADLERTPASDERFWTPPPAVVPGPAKLFTESVYVRGAMALEALRQRVGNDTFLAILREWATSNAYGNVTIAGFIALAETRSGQELSPLFDAWLYQPGKP